MTHPTDLSADVVKPALDAIALIGTKRTSVIPVRLTDPLPNTIQLVLGAIGFSRIQAAVAAPAIDTVLKELDALAGTVRSPAPEGAGVPSAGTRRRPRLRLRCGRGE